jgi:hypothetical protein
MRKLPKQMLLNFISGAVERSRERDEQREFRRKYYRLLRKIRKREISTFFEVEKFCREVGLSTVIIPEMGTLQIEVNRYSRIIFGPDQRFIGIDRIPKLKKRATVAGELEGGLFDE